jgi:NAD(P)-dependent dehydrogenase (short-subunit alcohol dehydrogenase family)
MTNQSKTAIVAGLGPGLGVALCRQLADTGFRVAGFSRSEATFGILTDSLSADLFMPVRCDITDSVQLDLATSQVKERFGPASVYIHNAAQLHRQPFLETNPETFESLWRTTCLGAVYGVQRVLPDMLEAGSGTLLFIGATASIKAGAGFSAFSSAKFALRGLSQSLARELGPQGIHVAHLVIDGVMWGERARDSFGMSQQQCLDPLAVAKTCRHLIEQDRSAWTQELDLRPDVETF